MHRPDNLRLAVVSLHAGNEITHCKGEAYLAADLDALMEKSVWKHPR